MSNHIWAGGTSASLAASGAQLFGAVSHTVSDQLSDQTLLAFGAALVALAPKALEFYQKYRKAKLEADVEDRDAYRKLLLEEIKALRTENADLSREVGELRGIVAELKIQLKMASNEPKETK